MKGIKTEGGGFDKVVFESVIDTLAGGATLDLTDYDDNDTGVVPAGTIIGRKDPSTGLAKPVTITPGDPEAVPPTEATFDPEPFGYVAHTVPAEDNCLVGVVIEGVARIDALPDADAAEAVTELGKAIPKVTLV